MYESIKGLIERLSALVSSLDSSSMSSEDAVLFVEAFSKAEKLAAAGRAIAAKRALETRAWRARGYRNPAQWMASHTGTSVAAAVGVLQTAHALDELPTTREALVDGRLSVAQAAEIVVAAKADPNAEATLLEAAERDTFKQLRDRCQSVVAAAAGDEDIDERVRRSRYFRYRYDAGAILIDARLAPPDAAPLITHITKVGQQLFEQARHTKRREPKAAYLADALTSLCGSTTKTVVHVHVDESGFDRGHTIAGERCEITGVGPIAVSSAKKLANTGSVKRLGRRDHDVTRVKHERKDIPAKLQTAIEARDTTCVVPGCDTSVGLEIDHITPRDARGETSYQNLCRLCRYHHYMKTHHGWHIKGPPGTWTWSEPPPGWKSKRRFNRN